MYLLHRWLETRCWIFPSAFNFLIFVCIIGLSLVKIYTQVESSVYETPKPNK